MVVNLGSVASAGRDDLSKVSLGLRGRGGKSRVSPVYAHLFRQMLRCRAPHSTSGTKNTLSILPLSLSPSKTNR